MSLQDKINRLAELSKETIGASFKIQMSESGMFKLIMISKLSKTIKGITEHNAKGFETMLDDAIASIIENRRPVSPNTGTVIKKPFTLFRV